jgi:carotenoid cleavage dioxygenase-like enzyme
MADKWPEKVWLMGPLKPMRFEAVVEDCIVSEGEIPRELNGGFYRCGGTWKRPTRQGLIGPFTLDGMVQSLVFREGRVDFRNRWVRTPKYLAEERAGRALFDWADGAFGDWRAFGWGEVIRNELTHGVPQGVNNVNVVPFAGRLLALGEQGSPPVALDPITLETQGIVPWSTRLSAGMQAPTCFGDAAFTAHPKWDPDTGELYGWAYTDSKPYTTLHWVKPDGSVRSRPLDDAPYAALAHDMWLTENYVVLPFQPLVVGLDRIERGQAFYGWEPDRPIVLALIRRDDFDAPIRWLSVDVEPEYVLHTLSANHEGDTVILDAPIYDAPPFPTEEATPIGSDYVPMSTTQMGRWKIDLANGSVKSERVALLSSPRSMSGSTASRMSGDSLWQVQKCGRCIRWSVAMCALGKKIRINLKASLQYRSSNRPSRLVHPLRPKRMDTSSSRCRGTWSTCLSSSSSTPSTSLAVQSRASSSHSRSAGHRTGTGWTSPPASSPAAPQPCHNQPMRCERPVSTGRNDA